MKKILVTLLSLSMLLSIVGCSGQSKAANEVTPAPVAAPEVKEEAPKPVEVVPEVKEEVPEVIEEVPEEEPAKSYVEENGIEVVILDGTYENTFNFTEYNTLEDKSIDADNAQSFASPTTVTCEVKDNGDGTKTVSYIAAFDIREWSFEFENYSSDTYLANTATGRIFSNDFGPNEVDVNGKTEPVSYESSEEYDEGFTTHTKTFSLTCPSDFEDYGLYLSDTSYINEVRYYETLDEPLAQNETTNRVIIK